LKKFFGARTNIVPFFYTNIFINFPSIFKINGIFGSIFFLKKILIGKINIQEASLRDSKKHNIYEYHHKFDLIAIIFSRYFL